MNLSCSFKLNFALYFCQIKETLVRELSEKFSSEISLLRHEVRVRTSSVYVSCHVIKRMRMLDYNNNNFIHSHSFIRNILTRRIEIFSLETEVTRKLSGQSSSSFDDFFQTVS